jgi:hypothetical protein
MMCIPERRFRDRERVPAVCRRRRRGAVLLLVLVVIPVLAFGAYSFTHFMRAESRSSQVDRRQAQARWLADSGLHLALAILTDPASFDPNEIDLFDAPGIFAEQVVSTERDGSRGLVSVVAPYDDGSRFGLLSESAKIPLHNQELQLSRESLMGLPNMTNDLADAILDWIDGDDTPRELGAESSYYLLLNPPYQPRNGPPLTLGELLLVKGVTAGLLFGEDANLNGVLDPNEDDGEESWPPDDANGVLDRGWFPLLTVHSAAANANRKGELRLNLNDGDVNDQSAMEEFHSKLAEIFDSQLADFVIAYRKSRGQIGKISDLIDAEVQIGQTGPGATGANTASAPAASAPSQEGRGARAAQSAPTQPTQPGAAVVAPQAPPQPPQTIKSPWTSQNVADYLERALEELAANDQRVAVGKVDVARAPAAVLRVLPNMTEQLADEIASAAQQRTSTSTSAAWLLVDGLVTLEHFRELEPHVAGPGRVFRVETIGYFDNGGPSGRIAALIDATSDSPKVIERVDLTTRFAGR